MQRFLRNVLAACLAFFVATVSVFWPFTLPRAQASACGTTKFDNPSDGQNFVHALPFRLDYTYYLGRRDLFYILDLYKGVPGNAQIVYSAPQGALTCVNDFSNTHHPFDIFTETGDYFYVLHTLDQIYGWKTLMDTASWENHWEQGGIVYDIWGNQFMPTDYAVSRFSVGSTRIPIVIVPGIGASMNLDVLLKNQKTDNWSFFPDGEPYASFIKAFEAQGYQENKDLFVAFYDWRESNDINDPKNSVNDYLIPTINKAKALCQCDKVAIVAHSMGGLVARSYVQSDKYLQRNDVSHLFLVGTPSKGSSDTYDLWEGGHIPKNWPLGLKLPVGIYSWLVADNKIAGLSRSTADTERYVTVHNNIPSFKQLLPMYDYLSLSNVLQSFLGMNQQNSFLQNLNQDTNLLLSRSKLYTFVGKDQMTVNSIPAIPTPITDIPLWVDGKPNPEDPIPNDSGGDTRVLLSSGELSNVIQNFVFSDDHGGILDDAEQPIAQILTNVPLQQKIANKEASNALVYSITSSADISVTDPNGKTIDKTHSDIPSAQYFSETDPAGAKIIIIENPMEGNYKVDLHSAGNGGDYQMLAGNIPSDEDMSSTVQGGTITNNQTTSYISLYNPSNAETPITLQAQVLPTITINSPQAQDYDHTGKLVIDVSVIDNGGGIASTAISLDGTIKQNGDSIDLSSLSFGDHTLTVDVKDNAGNDTQASVTFINIATVQSTIQDVEKVASCGCISKKSVEKTFINDLNAIAQALDADAKQAAVASFLDYLNQKRGKAISEGAYQLLLQDINWIQTH